MYGGFIFCAIAMLIFAAADLTCIILTKKDIKTPEELADKVKFSDAIKNTLGNRNFRSVVYLTIIWDIARYSVLGFLGTYRIGELAFTVGAVQIINFASSAVRFVISRPFGKFSDKHSFARGIEIALIIAAFGFGVNAFTTPATRFLIVVEAVCYSASLAGANQNLANITYNYVDAKYFVQASALKNSIGGIFGFLASLGAARLLDMIQKNGNTFLGMHVYGQQVLSVIACLFLIVAVLYTHFVIAKQKRMVQ
jgi:Na+/melibiose symporter-like transporter